ncbi:TPA: hypothetical protein IUZ76_002230 [Enterococcus faecalis]|nr:hypothetical protein [Enterococcus faecalis]
MNENVDFNKIVKKVTDLVPDDNQTSSKIIEVTTQTVKLMLEEYHRQLFLDDSE